MASPRKLALPLFLSVSVVFAGGCRLFETAPAQPSAAQPTTTLATPTRPAASPTTAAPTAAVPTTAPATPSVTSGGTSAGAVRLTIAQETSEARWKVREQLAGLPAPNEAVGSTKSVTGTVVIAANGAVNPAQSRIVVDLRTLKSDRDQRDNFIKQNTLQTNRFPTADLQITEIRGLTGALPATGSGTITLVGNLTVRGVSKPTTWETTVQYGAQEVTGKATTRIKMTEFGMTPPRVGPVLSIEDDVTLEIDFRAARAAAPAT